MQTISQPPRTSNPYKVTERIDWERSRLALGWALNSTIIIAEYGCDVRNRWGLIDDGDITPTIHEVKK